MEFPEDHCLTQDGVPTTVAQKILYNIVEKTGNIANNAIVQLSMQNTLVNDIDLSLGKLRQFCAVMIKQIDVWLRSLNVQSEHQERIVDLWECIRQRIKSLKEMKDDDTNGKNVPAGKLQTLEARVSKLENAVDNIQGVDSARSPGTPSPPAPVSPNPLYPSPESPQQRRPQNCPPCPPCPEAYPTGREYFGDIYRPPSPIPQPPKYPTPPQVDGRRQRQRAPPGQSCVDVIDTPTMAFPIPRAALEKEGRQRGQPVPLTPPYPPPSQFGAFTPQGASSPRGSLRESQDYYTQPIHPQMGQPLDPALIPKIQDDLQRLSRRNKKLEELVNNFRQMRSLLTDEMDKAVKLNQKLQRDLYYVAQEAERQP